ncbi:hypothetical protein ACFOKJ_09160 [Vogesella amnigena]|uniref:Glycosyltransferase 2-like domain-containing protein n=1 Tax=Vogesella amnigena TaxID=1507449 RepID=A0ABV7TUB5_9NEIS
MINFVIPAFRKTSVRVFQELLKVLATNEHYSLLVLIDNPRDIEVEDFPIPVALKHRIRVIRYNGNIGLSPNLLNSISLADREWLWICGDDDDYTEFPSKVIDHEVRKSTADIIKFSYKTLYGERTGYKNFICAKKTLNEVMVDQKYMDFDVGELIFTSNMILKVRVFSDSLNAGFKWCDTLIAHLAVMLHSNKMKEVTVEFSPIVAIGNNRYSDISWGRLDLYRDLIELSGAPAFSGSRQHSAIKRYCRYYITTTKLSVQLVPLLSENSTYREQISVLAKIAMLSARLGKFHVTFFSLCLTLVPLRHSKSIAVSFLQILSRVDPRFGRYAKVIRGKNDDKF